MYDNNYISSSQDMHNYLDQLSGLQPVYRKNLSGSSKCENQYTKPFRLSKISESTISKRGYEKESYQKDQNFSEWKKPKLEDSPEKNSKKCFPDIRDPRLKTTMVNPQVPSLSKPDRSIYDNYRDKVREREPKVETGKNSNPGTKVNPIVIEQLSKEKETVTPKTSKSATRRTSMAEPSKSEKVYPLPTQTLSKWNFDYDSKDNIADSKGQDVKFCGNSVNISDKRRKSHIRCVKIKVFPPLSKSDYENIWIKKAKVMLSEIPCSLRQKYKLKLVEKKNSQNTISQAAQIDIDDNPTGSVLETANNSKKHCEHPKQKPDRENFLSSMEKELDDTKKLTSPTYCESIWVDPKVMAMSNTLQKACNTNSNASTLAFRKKENPKSLGKGLLKKAQIFNLDKLRNSLQGTSINSSRNSPKNDSKTSEAVQRDRGKSDERRNVRHREKLRYNEDLGEKRYESSRACKQTDRDDETNAEKKNLTRNRHKQQHYSKSSEHRSKHHKTEHKSDESKHISRQSSDSTASIQYPQISSTNDPNTTIVEKEEPEVSTSITADVQKRKPRSRWDVAEKSNRQKMSTEDKTDSNLLKSTSLKKYSRIVSDSRVKQNKSKALGSNELSDAAHLNQDLTGIHNTQEHSGIKVSSEQTLKKTCSSAQEQVCSSVSENKSDNSDLVSDNVVTKPPKTSYSATEDSVFVLSNCDPNEPSSLPLQTCSISVKSPKSIEFLDPEVNEFALESFISEIEVETTVVENTVLEHATVCYALETQTPILNQILVIEQSKPLVSVTKMSLSEQILADTSLVYGKVNVLHPTKDEFQTSTLTDNPRLIDKDKKKSVVSKEICDMNKENHPEVTESITQQILVSEKAGPSEDKSDAKLSDSKECDGTVSNTSEELHSNTENNLVLEKFIDTDKNDNTLKVTQDVVGKVIESSQPVFSSSRDINDQNQKDPEVSKNVDVQSFISLTTNDEKMVGEILTQDTSTGQHHELRVDTSQQLDSIEKASDEMYGNTSIVQDVVDNTKEDDYTDNTEFCCNRERNEKTKQHEQDIPRHENPSTYDSMVTEYSNQNSQALEESPQSVVNDNDKKIDSTLQPTLLYEDISNSPLHENTSSSDVNFEGGHFTNDLPSELNSQLTEGLSLQYDNTNLANGQVAVQSSQSYLFSNERDANPSIRSSCSRKTDLKSTKEPDIQQAHPDAQLSNDSDFSNTGDTASIPIEIKQLSFNNPSLQPDDKGAEPPGDCDAYPDSIGIRETENVTDSPLQESNNVDVLKTACELTEILPAGSVSEDAIFDVPSSNSESNVKDVSFNVNNTSKDFSSLPNNINRITTSDGSLGPMEDVNKDDIEVNVVKNACEKGDTSGEIHQKQDVQSSNNITLIVDDNSVEGCNEIFISKNDDESTSSSLLSDNLYSETEYNYRPRDDKDLFEKSSSKSSNDIKKLTDFEFKKQDKESTTIKEDFIKSLELLQNDFDVTKQKSFYEGCPLYFSKSPAFTEGMKLPVRIASNDYESEESKTQFRDVLAKSKADTDDLDTSLSKSVSEDESVATNSVDHQQKDQPKLPSPHVLPTVSNKSTELGHSTQATTIGTGAQSGQLARVEVTPSKSETTVVTPPADTIHKPVIRGMAPQVFVDQSPLCAVIPSFQQTGNQRFVTLEPTHIPLAEASKTVEPITFQPCENGTPSTANDSLLCITQSGPLTMNFSQFISKPSNDDLPSLTHNYSNIPQGVKPYTAQMDAGRHLALPKANHNLNPRSILTESNLVNSIVSPIVSVKQFDTTLTSNKGTHDISSDKALSIRTNSQLNWTNQTVTLRNCEEQLVLPSDQGQTKINGTNAVAFPSKLPGEAVASLTLTNSSFGTILKISETVQTSDEISKLCDQVDDIIPNCSDNTISKPVNSDQDNILASCSEQPAKENPTFDTVEGEKVNTDGDNISDSSSDKSPGHKLKKESNKNPHIHISIPLSRIPSCHIPSVSVSTTFINQSSVTSSVSSTAASETSPTSISSICELSPPKLSPAFDLKNPGESFQVEEESTLSDCGSANTDETQLWKKGSSVDEIMSDETLIYSCDELEDIDQELKLNEKLKSEKRRILKVVQKLREELSENKLENNDTLIRKRRRSQVLESVEIKSLAETDLDIQNSNPDVSSTENVIHKEIHKSRGSKQKHKIRKKREMDNEELYDSDLDELPVIHPPKRRRLQKLNMQETAIRSNLDTDRIRLELPLHNWLEHKIKLGTESSKSSSEEVQEEIDSNNGTTKKKSKKSPEKDRPGTPQTKSKAEKKSGHKESRLQEFKDSETQDKLSKVPENSTNSVTSFDKTNPAKKPDEWRKHLSWSRSKSQGRLDVTKNMNASNKIEEDNNVDNKQTEADGHDQSSEVPVLSLTSSVSVKSNQEVDTNSIQDPHGDAIVQTKQSDGSSESNLDKDDDPNDGQLVVDENPAPQNNSDETVASSHKMIETESNKLETIKSEFEVQKSTKSAIEVEKSMGEDCMQPFNLTTSASDLNQPLNLCLKVSQDTQIKSSPQKPQPKVQLVHPQVISSTAKKKGEHTSLVQSTKMAIQSITCNKSPMQNDQNTTIMTSNSANQGSQAPQAEVCDFSMKTKPNISVSSQISQENQESNTIICLPATSAQEMTPSSNSSPAQVQKLPEDLEFQHHIEELRHLERLARMKEQEHAQVLALSRKKVETIMKLKLQKKRAAALNLSTVTFDKDDDVPLQVSARNSSPGSSSSNHSTPNTVTGKDDKFPETEKVQNLSMKGYQTATSNDSPSKLDIGSNKNTSKDKKSEEMKSITGRINEAVQQAVQNKTIKNPNSDSDKHATPQPAHQREKSTHPPDEPCRLPNDASYMCPFRLRDSALTDPSIETSKKATDKHIQIAHNQPAFQTAGSLIVPNVLKTQKGNLAYNFPVMTESNKAKTLEYKRSQPYNKEEELSKSKSEVIDLTVETSTISHQPPPLKRIKRDDMMEMSFRHNKSPLNNHHVPYDDALSRQILRSPNQRVVATSNGQDIIQPVPRYQLKTSSYNQSPPVYPQNLVSPTASSPIQNRLQYDRSSPYSRGTSPQSLYPMRTGLSNPMMRQPNVQPFSPQIRPEQQIHKPVHQPPPFPNSMPPNNPYGPLEPGEIITNRYSRAWHHPSQIPPAVTNPLMPEVTDRRVFPGQHGIPSHALNKQMLTQHFLQQSMPRIPSEQSHHPNGGSGQYRGPIPNVSPKVFPPHGMLTQPLQESVHRPNEMQQQYPGSQPRPIVSHVENNRACCVCGKVSCFICSGCRKVWYCSYQCQNAHWKVHSQYCKKS